MCDEKQFKIQWIVDDLANCDTVLVTENFPFEVTDRQNGTGVLGGEDALASIPKSFTFLEKLQQDHSYSLMCSELHLWRVNSKCFELEVRARVVFPSRACID